MTGASKFSIRCQSKSISLPCRSCRSNPISLEIEELLIKIKTTTAEAASADAICSGLTQLTRLYKCIDDLLTSSTTKVLMSHEQNKKWVDEFIDESIKCLDICGSITHMLSEIKEHSSELLSDLRRRKGGPSFENSIMKYSCFRKKMKKDVRVLIGSLKVVDNMINCGGGGGGGGGGLKVVDSDNHQLAAVIRAVTGGTKMTIMVFKALLMFLCVPVSKPNRRLLLVSKLIHKGIVACEDQQENGIGKEFERIDAALRILRRYGFSSEMNVQIAQCGSERLRAQIENMVGGLECIFRCMVRSRVSLLNIISH